MIWKKRIERKRICLSHTIQSWIDIHRIIESKRNTFHRTNAVDSCEIRVSLVSIEMRYSNTSRNGLNQRRFVPVEKIEIRVSRVVVLRRKNAMNTDAEPESSGVKSSWVKSSEVEKSLKRRAPQVLDLVMHHINDGAGFSVNSTVLSAAQIKFRVISKRRDA